MKFKNTKKKQRLNITHVISGVKHKQIMFRAWKILQLIDESFIFLKILFLLNAVLGST